MKQPRQKLFVVPFLLLVLLLPFVSAGNINTFPAKTDSFSGDLAIGINFVPLYTQTLQNITISGTSTGNDCTLYNGTVQVSNVTRSGNFCVFNNITLTVSGNYSLIVGSRIGNPSVPATVTLAYTEPANANPANFTSIMFTGKASVNAGTEFGSPNPVTVTSTSTEYIYNILAVATENVTVNSAPVMVSSEIVSSADNSTVFMYANATDADGGNLTYFYTVTRNGTAFTNGVSSSFINGLNVSVGNFSPVGNGLYIANITPYDGTTNGTGLNSNTLNLTFPMNMAPTVQTVTLSPSADNTTITVTANATDPQGDNILYYGSVFRGGVLNSTFTTSTFTQGVSAAVQSVATSSVNGTYIVQLKANDGFLNSSPSNSSGLVLTFTPATPPASSSTGINVIVAMFAVVGIAVVLLMALLAGAGGASFLEAASKYGLVGIIAFIAVCAVLILIL